MTAAEAVITEDIEQRIMNVPSMVPRVRSA